MEWSGSSWSRILGEPRRCVSPVVVVGLALAASVVTAAMACGGGSAERPKPATAVTAGGGSDLDGAGGAGGTGGGASTTTVEGPGSEGSSGAATGSGGARAGSWATGSTTATTGAGSAAGAATGQASAAAGGRGSGGGLPGAPGASGEPLAETEAADRLVRQGRYEDGIREAKLALMRNERYVPAMIVLAKAYYHLRKYELSSSILEIARLIDGTRPEIYNLLGFIALAREDRPGALAAFRKATELGPAYGPAWLNLSGQYLTAKNYVEAQAAATRAVQLLPSSAKPHINLGSALRGQRQYAQAESELRQGLQLEARNADAYFNLGILYLDADPFPGLDTLKRLEAAIAHLTTYKQLASYRLGRDDPTDQYIEEARRAMEREQKRIERQRQREAAERARGAPRPGPAGEGQP